MNELIIYLKLTNRCQLRCQHCYNAVSKFNDDLSVNTLKQAVSFINNKTLTNNVTLILHGGEPLYDGIQKSQFVIDNVDKKVNLYITTNLMYNIDEKTLNFFKQFKLISTSWDYKIRFRTKQQLKLWENNVRKLTESNINIQPIVSLNKYLINEIKSDALFSYFKQFNISKLNFERITETGNAAKFNVKANNSDIDKWLYNAYIENINKFNFTIPLFESCEEAVFHNNLIGCRKRQCQKKIITINTDGTICGCPNSYQFTYGDIYGKTNVDVYNSLITKELIRNNNCYICQYFKYCNGDCCQLNWDETGCPGMPSIFEYLINKAGN